MFNRKKVSIGVSGVALALMLTITVLNAQPAVAVHEEVVEAAEASKDSRKAAVDQIPPSAMAGDHEGITNSVGQIRSANDEHRSAIQDITGDGDGH